MDPTYAHLNFKRRTLRMALATVMKNVSNDQIIPMEMYSTLFQTYYGKAALHKACWVQ
jgi:hypothetical protein